MLGVAQLSSIPTTHGRDGEAPCGWDPNIFTRLEGTVCEGGAEECLVTYHGLPSNVVEASDVHDLCDFYCLALVRAAGVDAVQVSKVFSAGRAADQHSLGQGQTRAQG